MPAMVVDFRGLYGLDAREFFSTHTWNQGWELTAPLILDPYSHTRASLLGQVRPPNPAEEAVYQWAEFYMQMHRQKNAVPLDRLVRSWEQPRDEVKPRRSAASKAEGRRKLNERLGISSPPSRAPEQHE